MATIEQSRGYDFIAVGFSNDGRVFFAFPVITISEFERWKTVNKEYVNEYRWRLFKVHDYGIYPYNLHEQISIFDEH